MIWRNCILSLFAIFLLATLGSIPARAQTRVGEAVVVKNQVVRVAGSATSPISVGDGLLRDETVRTGLDSAARLVMADSTNLSLGPNASLKLDRTVFNDEHSYRDIAIRLTSGAFRFVTGNSDKAAYKISTGLATIGVRGTTLDILSRRGKTIVTLQHGAATVCTIERSMHRADAAWRHRPSLLRWAARSRSKRPMPAVDVSAACAQQRPDFAPSRIMRPRSHGNASGR